MEGRGDEGGKEGRQGGGEGGRRGGLKRGGGLEEQWRGMGFEKGEEKRAAVKREKREGREVVWFSRCRTITAARIP